MSLPSPDSSITAPEPKLPARESLPVKVGDRVFCEEVFTIFDPKWPENKEIARVISLREIIEIIPTEKDGYAAVRQKRLFDFELRDGTIKFNPRMDDDRSEIFTVTDTPTGTLPISSKKDFPWDITDKDGKQTESIETIFRLLSWHDMRLQVLDLADACSQEVRIQVETAIA